jgi:SAM-dependent methyltransferase
MVFDHLWQGKSLTRTALNWWVREYVKPSGRVCDVGGGRTPSYAQFVNNRDGWVIIDVEAATRPSVVAMLQRLPFQPAVFDTVCCFNVLEHVYEAQIAVREMFRVLRPGGELFIFVPFLVNVHADPYDYHRYTGAALEKLLVEEGFRQVEITTFFGLCSSLLNLGLPLIPSRIARAVLGLCTMAVDVLLYRLRPDIVQNFVISYAVSARKHE